MRGYIDVEDRRNCNDCYGHVVVSYCDCEGKSPQNANHGVVLCEWLADELAAYVAFGDVAVVAGVDEAFELFDRTQV